MLKPFVVYYKDKTCTKIETYADANYANAAADKAMDDNDPSTTAMVVWALSREDLETDQAHRVGGVLDGSDGMTEDLD